jgi:hypothetical protein
MFGARFFLKQKRSVFEPCSFAPVIMFGGGSAFGSSAFGQQQQPQQQQQQNSLFGQQPQQQQSTFGGKFDLTLLRYGGNDAKSPLFFFLRSRLWRYFSCSKCIRCY